MLQIPGIYLILNYLVLRDELEEKQSKEKEQEQTVQQLETKEQDGSVQQLKSKEQEEIVQLLKSKKLEETIELRRLQYSPNSSDEMLIVDLWKSCKKFLNKKEKREAEAT